MLTKLKAIPLLACLGLALPFTTGCHANPEKPSDNGYTIFVPRDTKAVIFVDRDGRVTFRSPDKKQFRECRLCAGEACAKVPKEQICKSSSRKAHLTQIEGITIVRSEASPACLVLKTWWENGIYHERCDDD